MGTESLRGERTLSTGTLTTARFARKHGAESRATAHRLSPGATIAVPSPALPVHDRAVSWLESLGYSVAFAEPAATPVELARAYENAFESPDVAAVFSVDRADGTAQLLRQLDYELIAEHPKPLIGSDEVTALHAALGVAAGLVTFWAPPLRFLGASDAVMQDALIRALTDYAPLGDIGPTGSRASTIVEGIAEGELVGGSACSLSSLMGTPWELDTRGKVLLLTAPRSEPWRIESFLLHLVNGGKLQECAGICLAGLGDEGAAVELVDAIVRPLGVPAVRGLPLACGPRSVTVPLGVRVRLDGYDGRLEVLEAGVC